jgi:heme-degrading monooxygenase HmoA
MRARVVTAQFQTGKTDEAIQVFRESVLPLTKQAGSKQVLVLADRDTDRCVVISLWDSEEAMIASETSGYFQQQVGKFGGIFAAPPLRQTYEVIVGPEEGEPARS